MRYSYRYGHPGKKMISPALVGNIKAYSVDTPWSSDAGIFRQNALPCITLPSASCGTNASQGLLTHVNQPESKKVTV
ncbi:MAG: hypothetical protein PVH54_05660 [Gammaproteobacteria bacterium]|jgi:hypothetical protein